MRWLLLAAAVTVAVGAVPAWAGAARYPMPIDGGAVEVSWAWPDGVAPRGLLLLQHGFARHCSHLRGSAQALADAGWLVMCLNAPMAEGNARLAEALAATIAQGRWLAPDGGVLPASIVVGGHSAGAAFAARVGLALQHMAPQRLAGTLLFDPVGVPALADRPTLAFIAPPMPCNAMQRDAAVLRASPQAERIEGPADATHMDIEGEDTDAIARRACTPGHVNPANTQQLRARAQAWLMALKALPTSGTSAGPR